jgi:hypothetical protein
MIAIQAVSILQPMTLVAAMLIVEILIVEILLDVMPMGMI